MADHHARTVPHARTSYYPGVGHAPFWEDPDRFNAELRAFAASV
jgi:pimeloyl-ACP methyl ester carboxylesterase